MKYIIELDIDEVEGLNLRDMITEELANLVDQLSDTVSWAGFDDDIASKVVESAQWSVKRKE